MSIPTLWKAIQNNPLTGFPCMVVKNVKTFLAPSPVTPKNMTKRPQTSIRGSTKQKKNNTRRFKRNRLLKKKMKCKYIALPHWRDM